VRNAAAGRALAEGIRDAAGGELSARAGYALLPQDAENAAHVLAASEEALAAASGARRELVAFDRGMLDGAPSTSGYVASLRQRRAKIEEIVSVPGMLRPVFQPLVGIDDLVVRGYEALSRFMATPTRSPDRWIAEAHAIGMGIDLEAECVRRALTWRVGLPAGTFMSINVSPDLALSPLFDPALGTGPLDDIVIEITEHERVQDYAQLAAKLALVRARGARLAIDDAGAGHSSLRHVMELRPDIVKIDPSLIRGLDSSTMQRAVVRSLVALNAELGAELVAEGVEDSSELEALRVLGVHMGQGYLFARPETKFARRSEVPGPRGGTA
jgi:EAL domain-containing protein (putative c-di-GMP-specific phosphodiesterase class I)